MPYLSVTLSCDDQEQDLQQHCAAFVQGKQETSVLNDGPATHVVTIKVLCNLDNCGLLVEERPWFRLSHDSNLSSSCLVNCMAVFPVARCN